MENTDEMARLHGRGLLPRNFGKLVEALGLDDVLPEALDEVRKVAALTEGQNLINRLLAKMLGTIIEANRIAGQEEVDEAVDEHVAQHGPPAEDLEATVRFAAFLEGKAMTIEEFDALNEAERAIIADEFAKLSADAGTSESESDRFVDWLNRERQLTTQEFKTLPEREQQAIRHAFFDDGNPLHPGGEGHPVPAPQGGEAGQDPASSTDTTLPPGQPKREGFDHDKDGKPDPVFDHDQDGKAGGSQKGEQSTVKQGQRAKRGTSRKRSRAKTKSTAA